MVRLIASLLWIFLLNSSSFIGLSFSLLALSIPEISELSLEEKVGQLLMVHFYGQEVNKEAQRLIQEAYVGGIIYYTWANELSSPQQVQQLSGSLQQLSQQTPHAIPLLIAIDQEGGLVNRLKWGFTIFPGNYALGRTRNWLWGINSAKVTGKELKAVGISMNLAPVVDVFSNLKNSVIGIRSFSSDPAQVAHWGSCMLTGYQQAGIIAVLKHFPGHGDVEVDSHENLPVISKQREHLEQIELLPFRSLTSKADIIMTGHLFVPALDEQNCTTFSRKIINEVLRQELNFTGVIMTDSLVMQGVLSQCSSVEEAAIKSLEAGHDLILLGGKQLLNSQKGFELTVDDIIHIHHVLVEAVKQGRLSGECLDRSVARLIALKQRYGLFEESICKLSSPAAEVFDCSDHCSLAQQIAKQALHIEQGKVLLPLSLTSQHLLIVAPDCLQEDLVQTQWNSLGPNTQVIYFEGLNPDQATIQKIKEVASQASLCLYFSYNIGQSSNQQMLFHQIVQKSALTVALAVGNPFDTCYLTEADVILCTFSPVAYSLQAAFDYLIGER